MKKIGYVIIALFIMGIGIIFYVKNRRGYMKKTRNKHFF